MTDQNNAAQAAIKAVPSTIWWHPDGYTVNNNFSGEDLILRSAALDALPKLRAEGVQAGDEDEAFEATWRQVYYPATMNTRRRDDGRYSDWGVAAASRIWNASRDALASAPVAGEAQPTDAEIMDLAVEPLGIDCDRMPHGVVVFARNLLTRYAAPQASEAVRNAALEACRLVVERFGPTEHDYIFSKRMAIQKCRAALAAQPAAQKQDTDDKEQ